MSTLEPPRRPTAETRRPTRPTWTRTEPCIVGRELAVWRALAGVLVVLLVLGTLLGQGSAATCAFLLLLPAVLMAGNRAVWWVRR